MTELELLREMLGLHSDDPFAKEDRERMMKQATPVLLAFAEAVDALFLSERGPSEVFLLDVFSARENLHKELVRRLGPGKGCDMCALQAADEQYRRLEEKP